MSQPTRGDTILDMDTNHSYKQNYLESEIKVTQELIEHLRKQIVNRHDTLEEVYMNTLAQHEIARRQRWLEFLLEKLAIMRNGGNE